MILEGGFSITSDTVPQITMQTESALRFFQNFAIKNLDQDARDLGLYAEVNLGRDLKGRFASFTTPKHLLTARANGCTWNPKGGVRLNISEFPTCPVEYDGEQCPDVFYGTCFERLFAPGSLTPLTESAEAQQVLGQMLERIYLGLGNSFYSLYNFANHPIIEQVNTTGTYAVDTVEWADYYGQQMSGECGGLITQLDALKEDDFYNQYYNLVIATGSEGIDLTTDKYVGDITELFEALVDAASPELKIAINRGVNVDGRMLKPVILVTTAEFNAYKKYIKDMAPNNELAYRYMIEMSDGTTRLSKNVMEWEGLPVITWEANTEFDAITGVKSHRAAIVTPGSWGVLSNVEDVSNRLFSGVGLVVQQSTQLNDKGKVFMSTTFRWGAAIADPKMAVMASRIISNVPA